VPQPQESQLDAPQGAS
jgi:hypothetical protein